MTFFFCEKNALNSSNRHGAQKGWLHGSVGSIGCKHKKGYGEDVKS